MRLGISYPEIYSMQIQAILEAAALCAKGGDWERKNRLKVYQAVLLMATRQFKPAAELLLDAISTFTRWVCASLGGTAGCGKSGWGWGRMSWAGVGMGWRGDWS